MPVWTVILLIVCGLFCIAGAVLDLEWFINGRRAAIWIRLFGRLGTRIFYALLGLFVAGLGIAGALGWI